MEKTFKEVVVDIKEGEIWESKFKSITKVKDILLISNKKNIKCTTFGFSDDTKFKLKRKEYSFNEAFKAYEEGKEIESIKSGIRFFKTRPPYGKEIKDCIFIDSSWSEIANGNVFSINEMREKWYIN